MRQRAISRVMKQIAGQMPADGYPHLTELAAGGPAGALPLDGSDTTHIA